VDAQAAGATGTIDVDLEATTVKGRMTGIEKLDLSARGRPRPPRPQPDEAD
jgi:hypothetical protein